MDRESSKNIADDNVFSESESGENTEYYRKLFEKDHPEMCFYKFNEKIPPPHPIDFDFSNQSEPKNVLKVFYMYNQ